MAVFWPPRDLVIMACPAKLAIYDVCHQYIVCTRAHRETNFRVANIAFEADAVKPVWKDYRPHALFFCPFVEYYISVFGTGGRRYQ